MDGDEVEEMLIIGQIGWWGDMGGPKQKGIVQYSGYPQLGQ